MTSVFSITIQRRLVSTSLPEKSSTMVIKMLNQVLKDSRKTSESGVERMQRSHVCVMKLDMRLWE